MLRKKRINLGFLGNTSVYMVPAVFSFAINILALPIYTRYLSPADFGIVILFIMFGNISAGLLSTSLHFASFRYYFKYKEDINGFITLNSTNILFSLIVFSISGIGIYFFSGWFSSFLFKGELTPRLIQLSFLSGCLQYLFLFLTTLLTAQIKSVSFTAITISYGILNIAFSFYFIFAHSLTYLSRIYAMLLSQGIMVFISLIITRDLFRLRFSVQNLKMSLKLTLPLIPHSLIGLVYSSFDKTMLNKFTGLNSVGYYSFGERFSLILKTMQDAVSKSWNPYFMNKAHENSVFAKKAIVSRFYELALLFMFVGIGIMYFSEEMIKLLTTKAFYPSMYVVPVYVFYYLFAIIGMLSMNQISFAEKMAFILPASVCGVIVNITLNIMLIPKYGAVGAAGATSIAALFSHLLNLHFGMKLYPLPLGKWRLTKLYLVVIAFTMPVYPIMAMDLHIIVKIAIKLIILFSFIVIGIKMHYISRSSIQYVLGKLKGLTLRSSQKSC